MAVNEAIVPVSVTRAAAASGMITLPPLVHVTVRSRPPVTLPLRSTNGEMMFTVATAVVLDKLPSLATTLIVFVATPGPPAVLLYLIERNTVW